MKVKRRGVFNVIQRQRPVFRKGQDGKAIKNPDGTYIVDGARDEVVVANVGGPTAEMLRKADGSYRGLMARDFEVSFSGDTFQSWTLVPVMDAQGNAVATPMSENDMALMAQKHDLDAYMRPPDFAEAARIVAQFGPNSGAVQQQTGGVQSAPQGNAGQAGQANGFLAGASLPAGVTAGAFGAAQAQPPAQAAPPAAPAPTQ